MARKPVHLIAAAPRPEGREVVWAEIRRLRTFTVADLEHATRITEATIRTYLLGLTRAGYLRRTDDPVERTRYEPARWELVRDVGVEAPRVRKDGTEVTQGRAREQMWRTMRILREFTHRDLAIQASTETCQVAEADAKDYVKYLCRAKYLVCISTGGPGTLARYRFVPSRYTGPRPPMIQRIKQVFDPNLGRVMWSANNDKGDDA